MDVFRDLITCTVCWSRMEDPRCLPCLHAFCYQCIVKHTLKDPATEGKEGGANGNELGVQCPTCETQHTNTNPEALPQDIKIMAIIKRLDQTDLLDSNTCFEHNKPLELFCFTSGCLVAICYKCSITSHHNHDIAEIREHYETLLKKLASAEQNVTSTVNNLNTYHDRNVKLRTMGNKLKMLVDNKVKDLIMAEKMKLRTGGESEDAELIELNRLQLELLDVKQRLTTNHIHGNSTSPVEMKNTHQLVMRMIHDLNRSCDGALAALRTKQVSSSDVAVFQSVVHTLLRGDSTASGLARGEPSPRPGYYLDDYRDQSCHSPGAIGDRLSTHSGGSGSHDLLDSGKASPLKFAAGGAVGGGPPNYPQSTLAPQVIIRFQVVNPQFDKYAEIKDCCLLGEDFIVIDKRNEWIKSFDVGIGRYIGANKKGLLTGMPIGVHMVTNETMLLVEDSVGQIPALFFVNRDLTDKEKFIPDVPEDIHEVCTAPTGQIFICTKSMAIYEQVNGSSGRFTSFRETRFVRLFQTNINVGCMASSGNGTVAVGCARDNVVYAYDYTGHLKWRFPSGVNGIAPGVGVAGDVPGTNGGNNGFKRLKDMAFDPSGGFLLAIDSYFQQVKVIGCHDGCLVRVLHGRGLQFARPICVLSRGDNQVIIMSEVGSVVVIEGFV